MMNAPYIARGDPGVHGEATRFAAAATNNDPASDI